MSSDNVYKPILSFATQRYRRNVFLLFSLAWLTWLLADVIDYSSLAPVKKELADDVGRRVTLGLLLGGLVFQGLLYAIYAEREIREWKARVTVLGALGGDLRLPHYRMYLSNEPVIIEHVNEHGQRSLIRWDRTVHPDRDKSISVTWTRTEVRIDGKRLTTSPSTLENEEVRQAVRSRHWVDIVWMGRLIPYALTIVGVVLIAWQFVGWPSGLSLTSIFARQL